MLQSVVMNAADASPVRKPPRLRTVPIELREANELVSRWHRHHQPVQGHRFSIGAITTDGELVGAIIVGRPVARRIDYHRVIEVTRLVTNGHRNACSILYSAAARAARALGYDVIQTYILESEFGSSLRASGWEIYRVSTGGGLGWHSRPGRRDDQPTERKQLYRKLLNDPAPDWRPLVAHEDVADEDHPQLPLF